MSDPYDQSAHGHSGSVRGFLAEMRRYPSLDGALFVLANQDESTPLLLVKSSVEQILFGKSTDLKFSDTLSPTLIQRVTGEYVDEQKRRLVITANGSLPTLKINGPVPSGYLGLDAQGTPYLFQLAKSENGFQIHFDHPIEFSAGNDGPQTVTLLGRKFSRVSP